MSYYNGRYSYQRRYDSVKITLDDEQPHRVRVIIGTSILDDG